MTPKPIDHQAFASLNVWAIDRLGSPGSMIQAFGVDGVLINEQPAYNER